MKLEVLISTVNLDENKKLIKNMNIKGYSTTINQIIKKDYEAPKDVTTGKNVLYSYHEKGLSKSRNKAFLKSRADICTIADDDMYYLDDYEKTILDAYKKYPDADIIAFYVEHGNRLKKQKEGKVGFLKSMRISSVQLTFKRKSIVDRKIFMDELFGTGSKYYYGEENIFLFDCLRQNLKIYYVPQKIAILKDSTSSWSRENTIELHKIRGATFYRMSKIWYPLLIIQFAIRKRKKYKGLSTFTIIKSMFQGAKEYKGIQR